MISVKFLVVLLLLILLLILFGGTAESDSVCCNRCYCSVVCPSVCSSVTLIHRAKADGRNEMPFDRDTLVVPSNIVLDRGPALRTGREDLGVRNPSQNLH